MAERLDAMSRIKLGRFQSQLEELCMSSDTEVLWYNETVCLWMTIYIYIYILEKNANKFDSIEIWKNKNIQMYLFIHNNISLFNIPVFSLTSFRVMLEFHIIMYHQKIIFKWIKQTKKKLLVNSILFQNESNENVLSVQNFLQKR